MVKLELDEDEKLLLKAAWEFCMESDDFMDSMHEALEVEPETEASEQLSNRVTAMSEKILKL